MVMQPEETAFDVWIAIEGLFRDNRATRVVYIEAEFHSLCQGDMSITVYCGRLKRLADNLRDVGQPVNEGQPGTQSAPWSVSQVQPCHILHYFQGSTAQLPTGAIHTVARRVSC
jgi:hypothetical protein